VVPPGTDIEWRIVITNRSTQDRVLCSIEMPQQRQRNFILRSPMPSPKNPIKVGPGGTHTQGIKFVTKRHELGVFRHTLLLNFSNFIYEHVLAVNVSTPKATEDLELLKPQSEFVRPTLPDSTAPELRVVPAFTVGGDGKVGLGLGLGFRVRRLRVRVRPLRVRVRVRAPPLDGKVGSRIQGAEL